MDSNTEMSTLKNLRYVKTLEKINRKFTNIKNNERINLDKNIHENIDKKISQISRQDIEYYHEMSMRNIVEMIERTKRAEEQMYIKMNEMIEKVEHLSSQEKENADVDYCSSKAKRGRKRKLPLQRSVECD